MKKRINYDRILGRLGVQACPETVRLWAKLYNLKNERYSGETASDDSASPFRDTEDLCLAYIRHMKRWLYAETEECMEMKMTDTSRNGII